MSRVFSQSARSTSGVGVTRKRGRIKACLAGAPASPRGEVATLQREKFCDEEMHKYSDPAQRRAQTQASLKKDFLLARVVSGDIQSDGS